MPRQCPATARPEQPREGCPTRRELPPRNLECPLGSPTMGRRCRSTFRSKSPRGLRVSKQSRRPATRPYEQESPSVRPPHDPEQWPESLVPTYAAREREQGRSSTQHWSAA